MKAVGIDERRVVREDAVSSFVVFVYVGDDNDDDSWSVHSYLLTDTDVPQALQWLREHLPPGCCWSLGVVLESRSPTPESHLDVAWIIGDDVLNTARADRSAEEQRVAEEMIARRHRVTLV